MSCPRWTPCRWPRTTSGPYRSSSKEAGDHNCDGVQKIMKATGPQLVRERNGAGGGNLSKR